MISFPRARIRTICPLLLALLPLACSRPDGLKIDETGESRKPRPDLNVPFRDSQTLPAGTLVSVRLQNPIAADNPGGNGIFDAVVDEAVLVDGSALLPRGAVVAGRVEAARSSELRRNRGYLRLKLDSVNIGGRDLPIQTSSLFVSGNADPAHASDAPSPQVVHLESGRRLTFRLTEPLFSANPPDKPVH